MTNRKKEMLAYIDSFKDMPDRLLKFNEILLEGKDATPECYQSTMSYRQLTIALTSRCNLACKWCYRLDEKYQAVLEKDLDIKIYEKFVENTQGKFRAVHLSGLGEPTLHPDFIQAISLSKKLSKSVKVTTNGTFLTIETITQFIAAGLTHIEISIDAFNREKLLEFRGVELDHLINIVNYISEKTSLFLQINSVVSDQNYTYLFNLVDVFQNAKHLDVWHTIPLFKTSQMHELGIEPLSSDKYKALLIHVESEIKKKSLPWALSPSSHGSVLDPVIEMKKKKNICFTCFEDPSIGVEGKFKYCSRQEFNAEVDAEIGFEKAWNHPSLQQYRKNMLNGKYPSYCGKLCFLTERTKRESTEM